jgi:thiol:disulfide interchange protein DsbD
MRKIIASALLTLLALPVTSQAAEQPVVVDGNTPIEILRSNQEYSSVSFEPAILREQIGIAVIFDGTDNLHYYAKSETSPAPGLQLKISAESDGFVFGQALFPKWQMYEDSLGDSIEVYSGRFTVFAPINFLRVEDKFNITQRDDVNVTISGIACTNIVCLAPFEKTFSAAIDLSRTDSFKPITMETSEALSDEQKSAEVVEQTEDEPAPEVAVEPAEQVRQEVLPYSTGVYCLLAILAGVSINIMPCVLPVIPLILMRLINQSKQEHGSRLTTGIAFCSGVILFFVTFAIISAVINISTGAVLDLNSLFRYPSAVIVLFLAIVFFALVMLDILPLTLPSSVASRQSTGSGLVATAGMGFFAGVLSTPCSGALLGFVLVWAQTQPLVVSSIAIVLMGVGMALPYALIMSIPSLMDRIPKPGTWMDIFKKSCGFLLFFIAVKLTLTALPKDRLVSVLMYGVIFSFCAWMWGKWVNLATPKARRQAVRLVALVIAVVAGLRMLPAPPDVSIAWQGYDRDLVQQATGEQRPVLIKFTADWCTNCKVVEKKVYRDAEVANLIETRNVLAIKADTTVIDYPATIDLKEVYGEAGNVPVTIVINADGERDKLRGIFNRTELIEILEQLPE